MFLFSFFVSVFHFHTDKLKKKGSSKSRKINLNRKNYIFSTWCDWQGCVLKDYAERYTNCHFK